MRQERGVSRGARYRRRLLEACAALILVGRYGRACRLYARVYHASPRLLATVAERKAWAEEILR